MPIPPGDQLGPYEILEPLGSGGMGEVFKARDTRLNRLVAIKILRQEHLNHSTRKQRFIQEAQAASALNHPNIVTIYDIAQQDGVDFMVMEYISGRTLDAHIPRHGMRVAEALRAALQIAEGLRRAHAAGIVHRDLKPSNIMVADDGLVKILDFGLAKLTETAGVGTDESTRIAKPETEQGTILGTTAYMSPEQAEGRKLDARTDIFSFGVVLYEMLTGRKAFEGETRMATLSAILKEEPKHIDGLPSDLEKIIRRCLRKALDRRFQHMDDVRVALLEVADETESGATSVAAQAPKSRRWMGLAAAALLGAAALGVFGWMRSGSDKDSALQSQRVVPLTSYPGVERHPSFSPDGNQVAFSWNSERRDNFDIYVKLVGAPNTLRLTTHPAPDQWPAWSPDGRQIAFVRLGAVYTVPAIGGPEQKVADARASSSIAWHPDGHHILITQRVEDKPAPVLMVPIGGGEAKALTSPPPAISDSYPAVSPDGQWLVYTRSRSMLADLLVKPVSGGPERLLTTGMFLRTRPVWMPDSRYLIFGQEGSVNPGSLWRLNALATDAKPVQASGTGSGATDPAISMGKASRLVFSQQRFDTNIWRCLIDVSGKAAEPVKLIASTFSDQDPQYSPDGTKIAYISHSSGAAEVWVCGRDGQDCRAVTSHGSPGAGPPRWSADSRAIVLAVNHPGNSEIHAVPAEGGKMTQLTKSPSNEMRASISRDGKWLYFASDRSGRREIWRMPFAGGDAQQVTRIGGWDGFESPDGKTFFFDNRGGIWSISLSGGDATLVTARGRNGLWAVAQSGLYFVDWDDAAGVQATVYHYSFATKQTRALGTLPSRPSGGPRFSIAPDERSFLVALNDEAEADLILVEGFR